MILLLSFAFAQQKPGVIQVNAGNAQGEIILDGFPTGQTAPTKLESVPPGEHELEVEFGCMKGTMRVTVRPEETVTANMPMSNVGGVGHIRIKELPYGADVMIDDAPVRNPTDGVEVRCGARKLQVEAPGFAPYEQVVVITTGKWATVDVIMEESALDGGGRYDDRPPERATPRYDEPDDGGEFFDDSYDELDALDEPDVEPEPDRRRDREPEPIEDFDELDELDDFDELDGDDEFDDDFPDDDFGDDFDDFDDEPIDDDEFFDEDYGDLDDDLDGGRSSREPREREARESNFPTRYVATGVGGAVMVTGIAYTSVQQNTLGAELEINQFYVTANQLEEAAIHNTQMVQPLKQKRNMGVGLSIAGAGIGAASWLLIAPPDSDVMVVPTQNGLVVSGNF